MTTPVEHHNKPGEVMLICWDYGHSSLISKAQLGTIKTQVSCLRDGCSSYIWAIERDGIKLYVGRGPHTVEQVNVWAGKEENWDK